MCSELLSRSVLRALNVILLVFGILCVSLGAVAVRFANEYFGSNDSTNGMVLDVTFVSYSMIAGGVLMFMSFVGMIGSMHGTEKEEFRGAVKVILYFYAVVLLVFVLLQVIGGGFVYQYADGVAKTAKLNKINPDSLADKEGFYLGLSDTEEKIDKYIRGKYTECCANAVTASSTTCVAIRRGLGLTSSYANNAYNACGVDEAEFYDKVVKFFGDNFYRIAGAMLVIGILELSMVISAFHLACMKFESTGKGSSAQVVQRELSSV
jgi:hypothetical protein